MKQKFKIARISGLAANSATTTVEKCSENIDEKKLLSSEMKLLFSVTLKKYKNVIFVSYTYYYLPYFS